MTGRMLYKLDFFHGFEMWVIDQSLIQTVFLSLQLCSTSPKIMSKFAECSHIGWINLNIISSSRLLLEDVNHDSVVYDYKPLLCK